MKKTTWALSLGYFKAPSQFSELLETSLLATQWCGLGGGHLAVGDPPRASPFSTTPFIWHQESYVSHIFEAFKACIRSFSALHQVVVVLPEAMSLVDFGGFLDKLGGTIT